MNYKKTVGDYVFNITNYFIMCFIGFIMLYPFYYLLIVSFSHIADVMTGKVVFWPHHFTLETYKFVLKNKMIPKSYMITIFITVVGTSVSLFLTTIGAYVLSKKYLPGRKSLTLFVVITMMFEGGLIPFYLTVRYLGLIDTVWALIFPVCVSSYNMIIMRNFFMHIPISLEESAFIDGCSHTQILCRIILPISMPVIATISLFYAVGYWNAFFYATIFLNNTELWPMQVILREILTQGRLENLLLLDNRYRAGKSQEIIKACLIIITVLPIICVYPFLQKYFVKGVLLGSLKG